MIFRVEEVSNKQMMNDFLKLPFSLYRDDPFWVPPIVAEVRRILNTKKNPYFKNSTLNLFICYKNNQTVARTALIINRQHHKTFGVKSAFFGFFEAYNDPKAVAFLFDKIKKICRQYDIEILEGPFNPNYYSELGIQTTHFDSRPTFFQTYNHPYYPKLLEQTGFKVSKSFFICRNNREKEISNHFRDKGIQTNTSGDYQLRSFRLKEFKTELERIRSVFNDAFKNNWHFLPLSREEYLFSAKYLKLVTRPELIKIVEYRGEAVGVLQCVLDINPLLQKMNGKSGPLKYLRFTVQRRHINRLIVYAIGIKRLINIPKQFSC